MSAATNPCGAVRAKADAVTGLYSVVCVGELGHQGDHHGPTYSLEVAWAAMWTDDECRVRQVSLFEA